MKPARRQRGAALMLMCLVLVLGACWWLVSRSEIFERTALDREHNARVLSRAKQALIGYVAHTATASSNDQPGRLPCPEASANIGNPASEGEASANCGLPAVGRFPWRTLGVEPLLDAAGEPLWYVVSPGWRVTGGVLNSNTAGQLTVDGVANAAAALIIAPGPVLRVAGSNCQSWGQIRSVPSPGIDFRNYLECQNATFPPDSDFVSSRPDASFNDQVLAVTAQDIWSVAEAAIAARFAQEVQPLMETALSAPYTTSQWGAGLSATTPMLPFAGNAFPDNSTYPNQGGLPLWRSQGCTAGTDPLCDPTFVRWAINDPDQVAYPNPSIVQRAFGNDTATISGTPNCTASTAQTVSCTITYSGQCGGGLNLGYVLGGVCFLDLEVSALARAHNVGRAVRTFTTAGIAVSQSPWSLVSNATPINSAGTAAADIRLQLPPASCGCAALICLLFPCTASRTVTVTVPIGIFQDHAALSAFFAAPAAQWYLNNRWYELTYYAVAPSHTPAGVTHDCRSGTPDCLTVAGGNLPANVRALAALTGYSLNGTPRPNAVPSDYLDSAANTDGNTQFEQKLAGRRFNDRFFALSKY